MASRSIYHKHSALTPVLACDRIGELISSLKKHLTITEGIGVELHPDNVNEETLLKLRNAGVTKISIGIQSFGEKFQKIIIYQYLKEVT